MFPPEKAIFTHSFDNLSEALTTSIPVGMRTKQLSKSGVNYLMRK